MKRRRIASTANGHSITTTKCHIGPRFPSLVTDVNGDRINDLIVGNGHGYGSYWYEQRIDSERKRTFVQHPIEEHYGQFHTMALADVNGDGKLDLVTGKRLLGHDGRDEGEWGSAIPFLVRHQGAVSSIGM